MSSGDATRLIYQRDIRSRLPPPGTCPVVDIGCGSGLAQVQLGDYLSLLAGCPGQLAAVTATDVLEHLTKPEVLATFGAAETGSVRGRIVPQNLTFAAAKPPATLGAPSR